MKRFKNNGRNENMKKRILSMFLAAAMVFSMTACSGDNKDNSSGKSDGDSITISVHPSGHGLPAYVAEQNRYYEEEGLNVETLVYIGAPPQMEAYQTGAWDIGTTGFGGIVLGVAQKDLKIIGLSIDDGALMGLWTKEDSPIVEAGYNEETGCYGTAKDWKDAEILYTQGTITDILLIKTLDKLGLTIDDVVRTNMDSSPAFTAFKSGSGDMVQANASFYFNAEEEGWVPATTGESQEIFLPCAITASETIIKERPEVVEKWVRAYMKGVQWIKDNPAKMFVEFSEANGVATDEENALKFVNAQVIDIPSPEEQMEYFAEGENGTVLQDRLAEVMDIYIDMGNYTEEEKAALMEEDSYDSSFMEKMVEE